jgi:cytochrome c
MKISIAGIWLAGSMFAGSAMAVEMPAEGKAKCSACHSIDRKVVGPAWKDVADKYKGQADAEQTLISHITQGGSFGWNFGMMPARGLGATDQEIASLAKFILTLQ